MMHTINRQEIHDRLLVIQEKKFVEKTRQISGRFDNIAVETPLEN